MPRPHPRPDVTKTSPATRFGFLGWAVLAWTIAFAVWWGPTAYAWWCDYRDILAFRETGGPPFPRRGDSFLVDLPFKIGIALLVAAAGYAVVLALAAHMTIARRHADRLLSRTR